MGNDALEHETPPRTFQRLVVLFPLCKSGDHDDTCDDRRFPLLGQGVQHNIEKVLPFGVEIYIPFCHRCCVPLRKFVAL